MPPVKEFMPIDDAKLTVEKIVKEKPKVSDLVKVESPGKPVPISLESDPPKKKKRRVKKSTGDAKEVTKKEYILIITEKPQSAQKIAYALGSPEKKYENRISYYELKHNNKKILVASAVGHLFNLTYVKGQKGWPIFNLEWTPSYKSKTASFTKAYYELLKRLAKKSKEFIIATDYDIEGEVIGWNVLRFICNQETAKRMKYSTLTKAELLKSFENPLPTPDWGQAYAGEARHIIDWLYGINLSRALMSAIKRTGSFRILSIGRVQGPALKIIVDREREIESFKPQPYWQVFAKINDFFYKHPTDIFDKKELEKFKDIKSGEAETKESEELLPPPHPFDLTTLQREAYRFHKLTPSQTLATAQKLYLDGLISYPRTSSQKIPESIQPKLILKSLEKRFPQIKMATRKRPIEGKKSDPAHPSIYPTGEYKKLSGAEEKLYNLIVKRFISAFCPDAKLKNKRTKITSDKDPKITFTASGTKIQEKAWMSVYPSSLEEKDIPSLSGKVKIDSLDFQEKETQPPRRYTPASLITLLEKKNLGTKATRSMIVDTLFERGYLDGKSIQATPLGMKLITSLEQHSPIIIDENLTKQLEEEMEKIQNSNTDLEKKEKEIIEKAKRLITDISKEFKSKELEIGKSLSVGLENLREQQREANTLMTCPTCKKGELRILYSKKTQRYFVACSSYPDCKQTFTLPPNALIKRADDKTCPECNFPKLLSIKKGKRPWEFCFNPNCPINIKRREEWEAKKLKANSGK